MKHIYFLPFILLLMIATSNAQTVKMSLNRDSIPEMYKWDLSHIYPNWQAWDEGLNLAKAKMDEIVAMKGSLAKGPGGMIKVLKLQEELGVVTYKLFTYPSLMRQVESTNPEAVNHLQTVQYAFAQYGISTAWITPEILTIPEDTMKQWIETHAELQPYRFNLLDTYRQQTHVLSEDKEALLAYSSQFNGTPQEIYQELGTSDIVFPEITLLSGEKVTLTPGNYSLIMTENKNQEDRKAAFEAYYNVYEKQKNTYAAIYKAVCLSDWSRNQARNYKSNLEGALDNNNIPQEVYLNLIKTAHDNCKPLQRYMELRKKMLGLKEQHAYDAAINLIDYQKSYSYDDAKTMVLNALGELGLPYQEKVRTAFTKRWIDVFENTGKTSGAFSLGVYGVHPYILMNFNGTMDNMFTLAHEIGHTCHSMLSCENQPFATHGYTIFVAEVASTFNEALLLDYMLKNSKDPKEKIVLLQQAIENIIGTFYTQALFADYELQVHQLVEKGEPVTVESLNGIMRKLQQDYYGESMVYDDLLDVKWARISHFYEQPFYVYQYATCFASSAAIFKQLTSAKNKKEKQIIIDRYMTLLKSGGNDYPMEQLRKAGIDLSQPETVMAVVEQLDKLVSQLEIEVNNLNQR